MIGIYKITNIINNDSYIGYSKNIEERWKYHITHYTKQVEYSKYLYCAFRKYGLQNFTFDILEECDLSSLKEREKYWIHFYDTFQNGYNNTLGGDGSNQIGEHNNLSLLTDNDIIQIRLAYLNNEIKNEYYRKNFYNKTSWSNFCSIWQGASWKHIMPEIYTLENKQKHIHHALQSHVNIGETNGKAKLTTVQVTQIIDQLINSTISQTKLATLYNVSYNTINLINTCKYWKHLHNFKNNIRKEGGDARL